MTPDRLRERLTEILGIPIPSETWQAVAQEGIPGQVARFEKTPSEVGDMLRDWFRRAGVKLPQRDHEPAQPTLPPAAERLSPLAPKRRLAVSLLLAREASENEVVRSFRQDVLGDGLIPFEQIQEWIQGRAESDGPPTRWVTTPLPPESKMEGTQMIVTPPIRTVTDGRVEVYSLKYAIPDSDAQLNKPVAKGGVLDRLRLASEHCANLYGWQEGQATIYILTGRIPLVSKCRVITEFKLISAATRLTLKIDPTLSPREVADIYQTHRNMIQGRRRRLSEKHITLAQFFAESPEGESLAAGMKRWNQKYRKWRYARVTNFGRDRKAVERRLLYSPIDKGLRVVVSRKKTKAKEKQQKNTKRGAKD